MIKNDLLGKIAGFGIFYRWHPAIALRYLPFVDQIRKMSKVNKILEVGSDGLGIAPYLKRKVTGADIRFRPPFHPLLRKMKASVVKLPFADSSFDLVISMDMLEHLSSQDRSIAINEMVRVADKWLLIGVPAGKKAQVQDIIFHNYFKEKIGQEYDFFKEQITEGLPKRVEIYKMIKNSAKNYHKKVDINEQGNENLNLRAFLMRGWITKNLLVDVFFRKILLFAIPLFRLIDKPPYYRQLFFVKIKNENRN